MEHFLICFGVAAVISIVPYRLCRRFSVAFWTGLAASLILPPIAWVLLAVVLAGLEGLMWAPVIVVFAMLYSAPAPIAVGLVVLFARSRRNPQGISDDETPTEP